MVLEVALLNVRPGSGPSFEAAFAQAELIIAASPGYVSHQLQRCLETPARYILLVSWRSLEDHTKGFRGSPSYEKWKALLHHYFDPFPSVEHYVQVGMYSCCTPTRRWSGRER